jgi:hypothetical protein
MLYSTENVFVILLQTPAGLDDSQNMCWGVQV